MEIRDCGARRISEISPCKWEVGLLGELSTEFDVQMRR